VETTCEVTGKSRNVSVILRFSRRRNRRPHRGAHGARGERWIGKVDAMDASRVDTVGSGSDTGISTYVDAQQAHAAGVQRQPLPRTDESLELILVPEVDVVVLVAATDVFEMGDHLWCS
jgi:hypothetical protein